LSSVVALAADSVPAVVLNVINAPRTRFPTASVASAVIVDVPPEGGSVAGAADTVRAVAAAAPIVIETVFDVLDDEAEGVGDGEGDGVEPAPMPPDDARTAAVPEALSAKNVAVAMPLRVCVCAGSTRPSDVVNVTVVPFCTGVPADSRTIAVNVVLPPVGNTVDAALRVIEEFDGANSGTLSHATASTITISAPSTEAFRAMRCQRARD